METKFAWLKCGEIGPKWNCAFGQRVLIGVAYFVTSGRSTAFNVIGIDYFQKRVAEEKRVCAIVKRESAFRHEKPQECASR